MPLYPNIIIHLREAEDTNTYEGGRILKETILNADDGRVIYDDVFKTWRSPQYAAFFEEHHVESVDSRLGHENNLYGDLKDGIYPVDFWLKWLRGIE